MRERIDCFLPCKDLEEMESTIQQMRGARMIHHIFLMVSEEMAQQAKAPANCSFVVIDRVQSESTIREIERNVTADYVLLYTKDTPLLLGLYTTLRMIHAASEMEAAMVYGDYYTMLDGKRTAHPVIDYQLGSVRDDFDFGSLMLIRASLLHQFAQEVPEAGYRFAGLYALRLFLSRQGCLFHLNEFLYTVEESDLRASGVKQFDYVNPSNREVQIEMEKAATDHLKAIGAIVDTNNYLKPDFKEQEFTYEASVIIPVFNREKTIADAVKSAMEQKTSFPFNVIVVDNHSTDRTGEILSSLSASYADRRNGLVVIVPERTDLGIGGCWNVAVDDEHCGRFAVQLDSDDLYSSESTLQQIVDAFYKQKAAMIVGSYRMCDFDLNTLPPGLISHAEWTDENGPNNALRINGLGAPRAFFTPLLRQIKFPNTSYGEDYALGLAFSRRYRIGRIFSELYLCRRWGGNSDAALSVEKVNANNLYKDRLRTMEISARQRMVSGKSDLANDGSRARFFNRQLETWELARLHFRDLHQVETRDLPVGETTLQAQFNPARMVSTGAKIDSKTLAERPCFLCAQNRPEEQMKKSIDHKYELLVNPYPILSTHYTIPRKTHQPQAIWDHYAEIHKLLGIWPDLMVFYNGPKCGASAPDHLHFQAGTSGVVPLQQQWQRLSRNLKEVFKLNENEGVYLTSDYPAPALLIKSRSREGDEEMFGKVYKAMETQSKSQTEEPMMNILSWRDHEDFLSVVFLRKKHRPDCYAAEGDEQMMVSPGALDMAGLIITPRKEDFERITAEKAVAILKEVSLSDEETAEVMALVKEQGENRKRQEDTMRLEKEPTVSVGIVSAKKIVFSLNKSYMAKGSLIEGEQEVSFSEGGVLWNGNHYRELTFRPQEKDASFSISDVTIGVNFHWERKETQTFQGTLRLVVEEDKICAINELPVEAYLTSVISSEMSSTSSLELLKAHAVISRSWLLAQMEKRKRLSEGHDSFFSFTKKDDELIRWYDREDHTIFDVCADDHCQRYQGITKQNSPRVVEAIKETKGQILMYGGEICDARFSKCCGGQTEEFQYCWEDTPKPYLVSVKDRALGMDTDFCDTSDAAVLRQVLNDYDQETRDFYRWTVEYTQEQLRSLLERNLKMDFGDIVSLEPLERGKSGRIWKLRIVGTERQFTIGKELEIRRALSETHLLSSAFDVKCEELVNGVPQKFILNGKGWGHGVGLCQIGAAVMGERGYGYDKILLHYYQNAEIKKIYK